MSTVPVTLPRQRAKPLMIYDGTCGFCMKWINRWRQATGSAVEYAASQEVAADFPEIPQASFDREVKLVTREGQVYGGAQAVFRSLNQGEHPGLLVRSALWMYLHVPGFALTAETGYRLVAANRGFFSAITRWM